MPDVNSMSHLGFPTISTEPETNPLTTRWVPFHMESPARFHCLLALAAGTFHAMSGNKWYVQKAILHQVEVLQLLHKEMAKDNRALRGIVTETMLCAVRDLALHAVSGRESP